MSLRNKIIFFGTIVVVFAFGIKVLIIPSLTNPDKEKYIKLDSPVIACTTIENYKEMLDFSADKNYKSAEEYLNKNLCERLQKGTEVKFIDYSAFDSAVIKPKDRNIHLFTHSKYIKE